MSKKTAKKGGARRKAPGGLDKVLFVRADRPLLDALDELAKARSEQMPGASLSRSDVARMLLWEGIRSAGGGQQ